MNVRQEKNIRIYVKGRFEMEDNLIKELMDKVGQEYQDFREEMLLKTKEDIFAKAVMISAADVGTDYLMDAIEKGKYLSVFNELENVLSSFIDYQEGGDGKIDEETIEYFAEYMEPIAEENKRVREEEYLANIYTYDELNDQAKQVALDHALAYIEEEYKDEPEILEDKDFLAQDEAENCATYYVDGVIAKVG